MFFLLFLLVKTDFQVGDSESLLTVLCDIKYRKTPWGLVKTFIEKNCWAGIEVGRVGYVDGKQCAEVARV